MTKKYLVCMYLSLLLFFYLRSTISMVEPLVRANGNKENVHDLYYFWVDNLPDQLMRGEYEIHPDSCAQSGVFENRCIEGSSQVPS